MWGQSLADAAGCRWTLGINALVNWWRAGLNMKGTNLRLAGLKGTKP